MPFLLPNSQHFRAAPAVSFFKHLLPDQQFCEFLKATITFYLVILLPVLTYRKPTS